VSNAVGSAEYRASIVCGPLLTHVLDRLLGALAARADLSVDRLNDLGMVGDAISAAAAASVTEGRLELIATPSDGGLELSFGPFAQGGAARVQRSGGLPGGGDLFAGVATEVEVVQDGAAERLVLRITR
jgi:hypothetical protein